MSVAASSRNFAARLWSSYNRQLDARPLVTKSFTSFFGFIVGDGVAQAAAGEKYDYWRTARFATYGLLIHGPLSHAWYGILDKNVMPRNPKSPAAVVIKMGLDQVLLSPIGICLFYTIIKTMEGQSDKIKETLKDKLWPTLLAGYAVWPLAHVINFRFIPNPLRGGPCISMQSMCAGMSFCVSLLVLVLVMKVGSSPMAGSCQQEKSSSLRCKAKEDERVRIYSAHNRHVVKDSLSVPAALHGLGLHSQQWTTGAYCICSGFCTDCSSGHCSKLNCVTA